MFKKFREKINKHMFFKKAAQNSAWIIVQNIVTMILGLIVISFIARYFGPRKYGVFNFVLSFVGLFSSIAAIGINNVVIKDLTMNPENEGKILGTSLVIRLVASVVLIILSQAMLFMINGSDKTIMAIGLLISLMMIFNSFEIIDYYLRYTLKMKYIAIIKIITCIVLSALKIGCILFKFGLIFYAFSYLIEIILYTILMIFVYKHIKKKEIKYRWKFDKGYAKALLSKSWYFALSSAMIMIYLRIDQTMLGYIFEDKTVVGIYSAAVKVTEMWVFVPLALIASMNPIIIGFKKTDEKKYKENLDRLYYIISAMCIVFTIGIIIFSKLIILILYGREFIEASKMLYILVFGTFFGMIGSVHYIWLICEDKQKYCLFYSFSGCISNIIFNIILIPKYGGYGAAIATLISQIIANIISFSFFKETRKLTINALKAIFLVNLFKDFKLYFKKQQTF